MNNKFNLILPVKAHIAYLIGYLLPFNEVIAIFLRMTKNIQVE